MSIISCIEVRPSPIGPRHTGLLTFGNHTLPCALGRSGISAIKREGDGRTPIGKFQLLYGYIRKDRIFPTPTALDMLEIKSANGWCDEPTSPNYNHPVKLPFGSSHEVMMRDDHLYDLCIVLDYNIHPKKRFGGSAIFFHLAKPDYAPTEGCVAIAPNHMRILLPRLSTDTIMHISL